MIVEVPEIPDERDSIDDNEWENDEDYNRSFLERLQEDGAEK